MTLRVALFCSHYYGFAMLEKILAMKDLYPEIEIVGVATDDPTKSWVSPQKRLWQYPHSKEEEDMVANLAESQGIPVWKGRVKSDDFFDEFKRKWAPDVCYMGVFGQRIPERIWTYPLYGFYNFHSCAGKVWPSNGGPQAFESMSAGGECQGAVAMHQIDNEFDMGALVAFSNFFPFFANEGVMATFQRTCPMVGNLMGWHLSEVLGVEDYAGESPRVVINEMIQNLKAATGV